MTTTRLHTAEELFALGSDAPYILIEGRLVDEMPCGNESSEIGALIVTYLTTFARPRHLGKVYGADGGFILQRNPDTVVAPDAAFVRAERLPPAGTLGNVFMPMAPDLAVEVLSPGNRAGETARKVELYRRAGVPLVWVIDPEKQTATVYAQGAAPITLTKSDALDGGDLLPGFSLVLAELFE
jgi:Uma2 family endonuclease